MDWRRQQDQIQVQVIEQGRECVLSQQHARRQQDQIQVQITKQGRGCVLLQQHAASTGSDSGSGYLTGQGVRLCDPLCLFPGLPSNEYRVQALEGLNLPAVVMSNAPCVVPQHEVCIVRRQEASCVTSP